MTAPGEDVGLHGDPSVAITETTLALFARGVTKGPWLPLPCGSRSGGCRLRGVVRNKQGPVTRVFRIVLPRVITPEPSEHLGHDRTALLVGMGADAPDVIHVVLLFRQRLDHLDVLRVPVAGRVVVTVTAQATVVVHAVLEEDADRLAIA